MRRTTKALHAGLNVVPCQRYIDQICNGVSQFIFRDSATSVVSFGQDFKDNALTFKVLRRRSRAAMV